MKRSIAILLAALLLMSALAGCGGKEPEAALPTINLPTAAPASTEPAAPAATPEPAKPAVVGTELDTEHWTLTYPDDWTYDEEEDFYTSEGYYSCVTLSIMDGEDTLVSVYVDSTIEGPGGYRDELRARGIDAYDMVTNNSQQIYNIGGIDCVRAEYEYWGDDMVEYTGRLEAARTTVIIKISGDLEDERIDTLLSTIQFNAEHSGNVDPPWPWDGEPFTGSTMEAMVASYTITSQWLPIDVSQVANDIFCGDTAVCGDKVYLTVDGVVKEFDFDGKSLTYVKDMPLDDDYDVICADASGTLYASEFMCDLTAFKDGEKAFACSDTDYVAMHPSGSWGISWFSGPEVEKISINNGIMTTEAWNLEELSIINSVDISESHIMVSGTSAETEEKAIFWSL